MSTQIRPGGGAGEASKGGLREASAVGFGLLRNSGPQGGVGGVPTH